MLQLKEEFKQRIKDDQELQLKIAKAFAKKNIVTVQRWVRANSRVLTLPTTLDIIRKHESLTKDVELTEEVDSQPVRALT